MEQNLKQRLVGAIVLVSLAVIFIPIILEGPDDEWTPRNHGIPEPPQMDYRASMPLPADTEQPAAPVMQVAKAPVSTADTPPLVETPKPEPEIEAAPEPDPTPEPKPEPKPTPVAQPKPAPVATAPASTAAVLPAGWYVQVGSFSQQLNATGLRDRLKAAGYDSRLQATGSAHRVLVGPADTRALAEKQRDKLFASQQLQGIVIEHSK